jgi:hypothetical protein
VSNKFGEKATSIASDRLLDLLITLLEFGRLALGLAVVPTEEREGSQISVGEFRVGDVFVVKELLTHLARRVQAGPARGGGGSAEGQRLQ